MYETVKTSQGSDETLRIDKWLWAARFFKTRSLAAEAVAGGRARLNGRRVKPARAVRISDVLCIQRGHVEYVVTVLDLSAKRVSAKAAVKLYEESQESVARREVVRQQRKLERDMLGDTPRQRPDKRQRRHIIRFQRERGETGD